MVCGLSIVFLGGLVLVGWLTATETLVRVIPGSVAVGVNAAICLVAAGMSLLLSGVKRRWAPVARIALAALLIVLPAAILVEQLFDLSLGIDLADLHRTVADGNPRPGRVAPNSALAFLASGICFFLLPGQDHSRASRVSARSLSYIVFAVGFLALLGYFLQLDSLYQWFRYNKMAFVTAVGICLLGLGLWALIAGGSQSAASQPVDKRIVRNATGALALLAAGFAFTGFALLKQGVEDVLSENLLQTAESHRAYFEAAIQQHVVSAHVVSTRPGLLAALKALNEHPHNKNASATLDRVTSSFLATGFSGVQIFGRDGNLLSNAGSIADNALIGTRLMNDRENVELLWKQGFILRVDMPLQLDGSFQGMATAEQPLTALTNALLQSRGRGDTGEYRICFRSENVLRCYPSRLDAKAIALPFYADGRPSYPVARAILGQSGITQATDYRGKSVMAAFLPIGNTGLGLVVKRDTAEMYTPLRKKLGLMLLLVALLVAASVLVLRATVKPLAGRLFAAERESRRSAEALYQSMLAQERIAESLRLSEAEVRTLNAELEARVAARTEALRSANDDLKQFAYAASHDLQEPLRNVSLYAELIARRYKGRLDADGDEFLGYLANGAIRMQQLLRDVLAYTKVATGESEPLAVPMDTEKAVAEALQNLSASIEQAGARVEIHRLPPVRVYHAHLVQLFQNLVGNAVKYRSDKTPQIDISASRQGDDWLFAVADNGIGIAPEYAQRIFGVFKRLHKDAYPGTGIGLAICQKIVRRYNGRIWVESREDEGATFFFTLPGDPPTV